MTERVVLSLGSNLEDRLCHLQAGLDQLIADGLEVEAVSSVYETAPVGGPEQGPFLNAVVVGTTSMSADDLLASCQRAESAQGRVRDVRWGPRTLDVDVIIYGTQRRDDPTLTLPHPRAYERAFVLVPWAEVEPGAVIPGVGPVATVLARLSSQDVRRRDDLVLQAGASR